MMLSQKTGEKLRIRGRSSVMALFTGNSILPALRGGDGAGAGHAHQLCAEAQGSAQSCGEVSERHEHVEFCQHPV
jgi:hypothetical protein